MIPAGVYLHVPFCRAICSYCDFARQVPRPGDVAVWLRALRIELETATRVSPPPLRPRTIFFGGGTPTSLKPEELSELLALVGRFVDTAGAEEFTVEANPGTLRPETFALLRAHGVNRLSFGVQSFQPRLLKLLGRIHSADQARGAVSDARAAGFSNVSIDLMHGLPTQTREELTADLDAAVSLRPDHISAYGLSYEEGTPLHASVERGEVARLTSEEEGEQYRQTMAHLEAAGWRQYEISNYARPGREAQHNLVYWRNEPYLGLGPSAASYLEGERIVNKRSLHEWAEALESAVDPAESRERLTGERRAREALMLALRLRDGADPAVFRARYDFDIEQACAAELQRFERLGLMERLPNGRWRISSEGLPVSNAILSELI